MKIHSNSLGIYIETSCQYLFCYVRKFYSTFSSFPHLISQSTCYVILDLFNIFLHQCGDIEVNPGPRQLGKYTELDYIINLNLY